MGIVKARVKTLKLGFEGSFANRLLGNSTIPVDSDDDNDDYEYSTVGCEPVALEDQDFDVPYKLYDLRDLQDVLSIEAWNSCLSKEERFMLSAYLPDMDQETFTLTMHELLNGKEIFFGNPLSIFFQRMKGGFYSMRVAQFREVLQVLDKRIYYHSLRSYHENMIQAFMHMMRSGCISKLSIGIQERLFMSTKHEDHKRVFPVDLNAFPEDDDLTNVENDGEAQPPKRTRYMDSKVIQINLPDPLSVMASVAPASKPKGVLKLKAPIIQSQPWNSEGSFRLAPKGVLKIKNRNARAALEKRLWPISVQPQVASLPARSLHRSIPSTALQSKNTVDMKALNEYPLLSHPKIRRGYILRHPEDSLQFMELRAESGNSALVELQEQSIRRKSSLSTNRHQLKDSMIEFNAIKNSIQNSILMSRKISSTHAVAEHFVLGQCQGRKHTMPVCSSPS